MYSQPESDKTMIRRLLPDANSSRADRAEAWAEWLPIAEESLKRFVRAHNDTSEPDDDLVQEALFTAYLGVENGSYQPREGVPFAAYVKGIARNKIREARRRRRYTLGLDEIPYRQDGELPRQPEDWLERREATTCVRTELQDLPPARKQVIVRFLNGETTGEIAEQMKISEALVRQHKCRGLKALKKATLQQGVMLEPGGVYATAA
jgi:RNA polymerase sigma factor (sigma-70 family)